VEALRDIAAGEELRLSYIDESGRGLHSSTLQLNLSRF